METLSVTETEIFHKDFNLDKKDNLTDLPEEKGVFGIFAIVNEKPLNCRVILKSDNIRKSVTELFENPPSDGMKKFMQGPWIPMCIYQLMPESDKSEMDQTVEEWTNEHKPNIDEEGEYPGYYEY